MLIWKGPNVRAMTSGSITVGTVFSDLDNNQTVSVSCASGRDVLGYSSTQFDTYRNPVKAYLSVDQFLEEGDSVDQFRCITVDGVDVLRARRQP